MMGLWVDLAELLLSSHTISGLDLASPDHLSSFCEGQHVGASVPGLEQAE